jgi:hypothetical protein
MSTHEAWSLVCRLFQGGTPVFRGALSSAEMMACANLGAVIKPTVIGRNFVLCRTANCKVASSLVMGRAGRFANARNAVPSR